MKIVIIRIKTAWNVLFRGGDYMLAIFFAMNLIWEWATWDMIPNSYVEDVNKQLEMAGRRDLMKK